jgi:hypothetical protein
MNIKMRQRLIHSEQQFIQRMLYGDSFWRPIFQRWLIWLGCSLIVSANILILPKLIRFLLKAAALY